LLNETPDATAARLLLGAIYLDSTPPAARTAALAVLDAEPGNREALNLLTSAYDRTRAAGLAQADEARLRELEIADYLGLLERNPNWSDALYRSASQRLALERLLPVDDLERRDAMLSAAVAELTQLVSTLRVDAAAVERAAALYQLGRALKHAADFLGARDGATERGALFYDRALTAFGRAFEIDPGRVDAVGEIVLVELVRGDPDAAVRAVETRIPKASTPQARAKLYSTLGNLYLQTGRADEALDAFDSVLKSGAGPMDTYLGLYRIHHARKDLPKAQAALEAAVTVRPTFVMGYLKLGELSAGRGDYATATAHFEQALSVPPQKAEVLGMMPSRNVYRNGLYYQAASWLAWLYLEHAKNPRRALQAVATARNFGAIDPRLADTEGWSYFHLGEYPRARATLEAVGAKASDFPAVHYHLAQTYAALGDTDAATRAVRRALKFGGNFSDRSAAEALSRELEARPAILSPR
jgi:tetratricopeptide (TPR) repeat protein